jgi:hypothetical protein
LLLRAGAIKALKCHPSWQLKVGDVLIGRYTADFSFIDTATGKLVVEDVKGGPVSRDYPLRVKLLKALYGIDVVEVRY